MRENPALLREPVVKRVAIIRRVAASCLLASSAWSTGFAAVTDSSLRNTYWKLVRLGGASVEVVERQREPHLIFALHEMRVSGSGGCNRIAGPFDLDGDTLYLRRLASTRMACTSGMEQEDRFLRALETVERYSIRGNRLELFDVERAVVAEFEAVALR